MLIFEGCITISFLRAGPCGVEVFLFAWKQGESYSGGDLGDLELGTDTGGRFWRRLRRFKKNKGKMDGSMAKFMKSTQMDLSIVFFWGCECLKRLGGFTNFSMGFLTHFDFFFRCFFCWQSHAMFCFSD